MSIARPKFLKIAGIFLALSVLLTAFTGCEWWPFDWGLGKTSVFERGSLSQQGLMAEDFMPADISTLIVFNTLDGSEKAEFVNLLKLFPEATDPDSIWASVRQGDLFSIFKAVFEDEGVDYETEVKPMLGENMRMVVGVNDPQEGEVYIATTLQDADKFYEVLDREREGDLAVTEYKGAKMIELDDMAMLLYKDMLMFATDLKQIKAAMDTRANKEGLRRSKDYQATVKKLGSPYLVFIYVNLEGMMENTKAQMEEIGSLEEYEKMIASNPMMEAIKTEGIIFMAEKEGLRVGGVVTGDKAKMEAAELTFSDFALDEPTLVDLVPGEGMMFYSEGKNLAMSLEMSMKTISAVTGSYEELKEQVKAMTNLDLEEDILSWMDKAYAMALQRAEGSLIPAMTVIADASSNLEAAQKVMTILEVSLTALKAGFQFEMEGTEGMFAQSKKEMQGGTLEVFTVVLDEAMKLNETAALLAPYVPEVDKLWSLYYGVVGNNLLLSSYGKFAEEYGVKPFSATEAYKKAISRVSSKGQFVYMSFSEVWEMVSDYIDFAARANDEEGDEMDAVTMAIFEAQYAQIEQYLTPFKYLVMVSKVEDYEMEFDGFLEMGAGTKVEVMIEDADGIKGSEVPAVELEVEVDGTEGDEVVAEDVVEDVAEQEAAAEEEAELKDDIDATGFGGQVDTKNLEVKFLSETEEAAKE